MKGILLSALAGFTLVLAASMPAHASAPVQCFTKCKWISQPGGCGPCNACTIGFSGGWTNCVENPPCGGTPCQNCCTGGCTFSGNPC